MCVQLQFLGLPNKQLSTRSFGVKLRLHRMAESYWVIVSCTGACLTPLSLI